MKKHESKAIFSNIATVMKTYSIRDMETLPPRQNTNSKEDFVMREKIYDLDGARGRHIDIYDDKVVLTVKAGIGSFLTENITDGEKTIYYSDCIGVQFKKSGLLLGYLQFETAGSIMNNRSSNFFNENTFTWDGTKLSNNIMEEAAEYCKQRMDEYKSGRSHQPAATTSPASELKEFKNLLDMGLITQEEFDAKKKQILGL